MAIKKQLKDKDGNTIYPDVGLDLDSVIYSDDPTTPTSTDPWIEGDDVVWSTMKRWVPDYSNPTSLGSGSSITITAQRGPGFVSVWAYGYSTTTSYEASVKVNGNMIFSENVEATAPNGARAANFRCFFPVSVGDVIAISGSGNRSTTFFPGKWV